MLYPQPVKDDNSGVPTLKLWNKGIPISYFRYHSHELQVDTFNLEYVATDPDGRQASCEFSIVVNGRIIFG